MRSAKSCLIKCGKTKYYMQTFNPEQTIPIELTSAVIGDYTFTVICGNIPSEVEQADIITEGQS